MNTIEKIGQVIKLLRAEHGLSQEQLSSQCGIDQHYISNIERGQRNVSIDILERFSSFFGMTLSQFFSCVESIDDRLYCPSSGLTAEFLEEGFVRFMREQKLSERTINKYSADTPNSPSVQRIIKDVTGYTDNMYNVRDLELLDKIIAKVSASEFDQIGHSMYSAGLKKYKLFLGSGFSLL